MKKDRIQTFRDTIHTVFIYYATLLLGWQVVIFYDVFNSMNPEIIDGRLHAYMRIQPVIISIGIGVLFLFLLVEARVSSGDARLSRFVVKDVVWQAAFLAVLIMNSLLYQNNFHGIIYELVIFFMAIGLMIKWGSLFFNLPSVGWHHPTTHGSFIISSLLSGFALLSLTDLVDLESFKIWTTILVLLGFELLILYARFQYLSKTNAQTRTIAKRLMGNQIFLFGIRIIVGIFMPGIFLVYNYFAETGRTEGIGILLLLGTFLDRYLFVSSGNLTTADDTDR